MLSCHMIVGMHLAPHPNYIIAVIPLNLNDFKIEGWQKKFHRMKKKSSKKEKKKKMDQSHTDWRRNWINRRLHYRFLSHNINKIEGTYKNHIFSAALSSSWCSTAATKIEYKSYYTDTISRNLWLTFFNVSDYFLRAFNQNVLYHKSRKSFATISPSGQCLPHKKNPAFFIENILLWLVIVIGHNFINFDSLFANKSPPMDSISTESIPFSLTYWKCIESMYDSIHSDIFGSTWEIIFDRYWETNAITVNSSY